MSYSGKNNLLDQISFLDKKILPLYGILGVSDTTTRISVNSNIDYKGITKLVDTIKLFFKVSQMKLAAYKYQITRTNAIAVLRHMCDQAQIPYIYEKTKDGYLFNLSDENRELIAYKKIIQNRLTQQVDVYNVKIENLSHVKNTVNGNKLRQIDNNVKAVIDQYKNSGLAKDFNPTSYISNGITELFKLLIESCADSVTYNFLMAKKVNAIYTCCDEKFIFIPIPRSFDFIKSVKDIKLYDKNSNLLDINEYKIYICTGLTELDLPIKNMNSPIYSMAYTELNLKIKGENLPVYYSVNYDAMTLSLRHRRKLCKKWGNYSIENNALIYDTSVPDNLLINYTLFEPTYIQLHTRNIKKIVCDEDTVFCVNGVICDKRENIELTPYMNLLAETSGTYPINFSIEFSDKLSDPYIPNQTTEFCTRR